MAHEILDGETFAKRVINSVKAALAKPRKIKSGLAQRLARKRACVDTRAAQLRAAFDERDFFSEIRGLRGALFSRRTAADNDQIKVLHGKIHLCNASLVESTYRTNSIFATTGRFSEESRRRGIVSANGAAR